MTTRSVLTTDPVDRLEHRCEEIEYWAKKRDEAGDPHGAFGFLEIDCAKSWRTLIAMYREVEDLSNQHEWEREAATTDQKAVNAAHLRDIHDHYAGGLRKAIEITAEIHAPANPIIAAHEENHHG